MLAKLLVVAGPAARTALEVNAKVQTAVGPPPPEPKPAAAEAKAADLPERAELLTGHVLANYKVGEMLFRGRSGVVFKAHDLKHGRAVALKAMAPAYGTDDKNKQQFTKS